MTRKESYIQTSKRTEKGRDTKESDMRTKRKDLKDKEGRQSYRVTQREKKT